MTETINATELPLLNIFDDRYRFSIPDYQRPYSWTTEQVSELLDDLMYATRGSNETSETPPYFLGSIVIIKSDSSPTAYVVDGQQRITTLTILFCVLRELTTPLHLRDTRDTYVRETSNPDAGIEGKYRLSVRDRDNQFFQNNIQQRDRLGEFVEQPHSDLPDSQQRMAENAKYLWVELSKFSEEERDVLMRFLVQRCYLVVVSTANQDSAYRIFSVLNDRGLDLSPTDILKAQIIGKIKDKNAHSEYTKTWEDIEEELGRDGFRNLFAHIRMIYLKDKARESLNKEFQAGVLKNRDRKTFIDDVLTPYADAYERVVLHSSNHENTVDSYLTHLGRLDNSDWIPPAMEFFKLYSHDRDLAERFVRDLERLAYGMFIRRTRINERIRRYADVLRAIEKGQDLFEGLPLQLSDEEVEDILGALDGSIYSMLRVRMPLMLRIDSALAQRAGAGVTFQHKIISIEHVLPQNPPSQSMWLEWFSDEAQRDYWTHRLANLVLLSRRKNAQANNREFADKKSTYFMTGGVSPFTITTQVIAEDEWTPAVLERRQRDLLDILKAEWRLC